MNKLTYKSVLWGVLLALLMCHDIKGQVADWSISSFSFFDNQEYKSPYHIDQTMAGTWITPEIGLNWNKKHSLRIGGGGLINWGENDYFNKGVVNLYYQYTGKPFRFIIGSFSREKLLGEFSNALVYDSIYYYRPNLQGFAVQYINKRYHFELFLDWTQRQSETKREQFMAGLSGKYNLNSFFGAMEGYYYHYAKIKNAPADMFIQDYAIAQLVVGLDFSRQTSLDSLYFHTGLLAGVERNRGLGDWHTPCGWINELRLGWKRFLLKDVLYVGKGQQYFGNEGIGKYYWNDAFFRASIYNKAELQYQFLRHKYVNGHVDITCHYEQHQLNWQQKLVLQVNLSDTFRKSHKKSRL